MAQPLGGVARTKLCLVTPPHTQVDGLDQRCEYLGKHRKILVVEFRRRVLGGKKNGI